jgi:hypothetical protein
MNLPAANSGGFASPGSPPPPISFFLVLPDGSCVPATATTRRIIMTQARSEARKRARIRRLEKAAELQSALEDRAAARRIHQELAEIERDRIRWAARFRAVVCPNKPETRTSPARKRLTSSRLPSLGLRAGSMPQPSSWVVDDLGMRGVSWQQSYLGRRSASFHVGAARDHWDYLARDEAVLLGADGEPIIVSNMGEDWVEIGVGWQAMEDASTRANAKIQMRTIVAFDADARPEEMQESLRHFCETILAPLGLPYSAVIHAPPEQGDQRNYHGHVAFSLRPMRRVEPYGWEIADEIRGELDGRDGVQMLRHLWAHSMSEAAERAGRTMRYTGLGYGARGLDLEAGEHLGEGRSAILARGGHVWAQERNRIKTARNAARRAIRDADQKIAALTAIRDAALARIAREQAGTGPARLHMSQAPTPAQRLQAPRVRLAPSTTATVPSPVNAARVMSIGDSSRPRVLHPSAAPAAARALAASPSTPAATRDLASSPMTSANPSPVTSLEPPARATTAGPNALRSGARLVPVESVMVQPARPARPARTLRNSGHDLVPATSLTRGDEVRTPMRLTQSRSGSFMPATRLMASEPARPIAIVNRPRSVAPAKPALTEWPQDRTMVDQLAELLRRLAETLARARAARKREAARRRERQVALADLPLITDLPLLKALPTREQLEHEAMRVSPTPAQALTLSLEDRRRLDHLVTINAYVADYEGGTLELHPRALKTIGANERWSQEPAVQAVLADLRAEQQRMVAALAHEAARRPLAFARTGTRFWPRDLDPASLARLDRWATDDGFQRDVFAVEQAIGKAHDEQERARCQTAAEQVSAASKPVADGFGGWRDTPAPIYRDPGPHVRIAAFGARDGRPTDQLLMLLNLTGEHPHSIVFASDDLLMAVAPAPAMLAPLLHGWRHDERVAALVTGTVRASREAGRPTWPAEIAPAVRAYAARGAGTGRAASPTPDLSRGPSR